MILKIGVENNRDYPRLFASRPKIGGLRNGGNIHAINNTITTCLPINASRLHPSHAPWQPNTSCGAHGAPSPPGCAWAWMCQDSIVSHTVPGAPKKWGPEKVCGGSFSNTNHICNTTTHPTTPVIIPAPNPIIRSRVQDAMSVHANQSPFIEENDTNYGNISNDYERLQRKHTTLGLITRIRATRELIGDNGLSLIIRFYP